MDDVLDTGAVDTGSEAVDTPAESTQSESAYSFEVDGESYDFKSEEIEERLKELVSARQTGSKHEQMTKSLWYQRMTSDAQKAGFESIDAMFEAKNEADKQARIDELVKKGYEETHAKSVAESEFGPSKDPEVVKKENFQKEVAELYKIYDDLPDDGNEFMTEDMMAEYNSGGVALKDVYAKHAIKALKDEISNVRETVRQEILEEIRKSGGAIPKVQSSETKVDTTTANMTREQKRAYFEKTYNMKF